jgi:predicted membrane protein
MLPFAIGGTVAWAVVGLALLPFRRQLETAGHGSWIWTCVAGFLIGFPGIAVMLRHDAQRRRHTSA